VQSLDVNFRGLWLFCVLAMVFTSGAGAAMHDSVDQLTIDGTQQRIFVTSDDTQPVTQVMVVFPGGDGHLGLSDTPPPPASNNGYTATLRRDLAQPGTALVLVDAPARQPRMSLGYRESDEYRSSLKKLLEALRKRFVGSPIYLIGYSNGAVSALVAGHEPGVAGVILVSGVFRKYSDFAEFGVKVPVLVIHHQADRCVPPEFDESFRLMLRPTMVRDIATPYGAAPCGPLSAHQMYGQEAAVAVLIRNWLATGRAPARIR
jgi:predicted esterase